MNDKQQLSFKTLIKKKNQSKLIIIFKHQMEVVSVIRYFQKKTVSNSHFQKIKMQ